MSELIGDRQSVLRALRKMYSTETRQAAWERAKRIAKARTARAAGEFRVSPQQVNWDFVLFISEIRRRMA